MAGVVASGVDCAVADIFLDFCIEADPVDNAGTVVDYCIFHGSHEQSEEPLLSHL